jgi:hypothetical protein
MTNFLSRRDLKLLKAESNLPTDTSSGDKVLSAIAKFRKSAKAAIMYFLVGYLTALSVFRLCSLDDRMINECRAVIECELAGKPKCSEKTRPCTRNCTWLASNKVSKVGS